MSRKEQLKLLVETAKIGDEKAKLTLINELSPLIKASIKKHCPVWKEYEDLYQDGVSIVLECIEIFDNSKGEFLVFLNSHLKYYYLETMKYIASKNADVSTTSENESVLDFISDDLDLEREILEKESVLEIRENLLLLTERQLEVIVLYYFCNVSHEKIAKKLDISKWTVINLKRSALDKLRRFYNVNK